MSVLSGKFCRRCQETFVCGCRCDGTGIHKSHRRNLTILNLGSFTIREVSCRVTDTKRIVRRCIACAKARTTECCFYNCTSLKQICQNTILRKFHINRCTCRIYTQSKLVISDACTAQDICRITDIFKSTTGTSGNDSLIYIQLAIDYFIFQCEVYFTVQTYQRTFFYIVKHIFQVCIYFINRICIAWMERHCDHRSDLT